MCVRSVVIIVSFLLTACLQTPRASMFAPKSADGSEQLPSPKVKSQSTAAKLRFSDTTYVRLSNGQQSSISILFETAQSDFDDQNISAAEKHFSILVETLDEGDSLSFESRFMLAECDVQLNKFNPATQKLKALLVTSGTPESVRERSLLRLGQVYCAMNKKEEAQKVFTQFKRDYARSSFAAFASCESIQK